MSGRFDFLLAMLEKKERPLYAVYGPEKERDMIYHISAPHGFWPRRPVRLDVSLPLIGPVSPGVFREKGRSRVRVAGARWMSRKCLQC